MRQFDYALITSQVICKIFPPSMYFSGLGTNPLKLKTIQLETRKDKNEKPRMLNYGSLLLPIKYTNKENKEKY